MISKFLAGGLLLAALVVIAAPVSQAGSSEVPRVIPYHGRLTDLDGFPVNVSTSIIFSIYADSTTAIPVWKESAIITPADDGSFSWLLGQTVAIDSQVFDGTIRYLGLTVDGNSEMRPRFPVGSVPYAMGSEVGDLRPEQVVGTAATLADDQTLTGRNVFSGPVKFNFSEISTETMTAENYAGGTAIRLLSNSDGEAAFVAITGTMSEPFPGQPTGSGPILRGYRATYLPPPNGLELDLRFSVENNGTVLASGPIVGGGTDFAEMLPVYSDPSLFSAGDVVEIDTEHPGHFRLSQSTQSPLVAGIVSEHSGFIGTAESISASVADLNSINGESDQRFAMGHIPVAVLGVAPCRVTTEGGAIMVGDLLVTSSTPGHAMKDTNPTAGTILGKALEEHTQGTGIISVLITLR